MAAEYGSLPFQEAIDFFRAKDVVPTQRGAGLMGAANDRGFHVAGAMKADLLADLHTAVDKIMAKGITLKDFERDFERIVAQRGWTGWTGENTPAGRAWRARTIYETNLQTAYQAGRWAQVQETKARRPYLEYRHSDASIHPRPLHQSWNGLVVAVDDPWVASHWPPNGWGCKCRMYSIGPRDLKRMGKDGPDTPPDDGVDRYTDKLTGEVKTVPRGIDPGWDYAPGASLADQAKQISLDKAKTLPQGIGDALIKHTEALPKINQARAEAIHYVTENGKSQGVEFAAVYDAQGQTVLRKGGKLTNVEFSLDELDTMRAAEQPILVHNHTKEGSLSIDDWMMHADVPLAEIVAVTPGGTVYQGATLERRRIMDHYDVIARITRTGLENALARDAISEDEANRYLAHTVNRVMQGLGWVRYEATAPEGWPLADSDTVKTLAKKIIDAAKERLK